MLFWGKSRLRAGFRNLFEKLAIYITDISFNHISDYICHKRCIYLPTPFNTLQNRMMSIVNHSLAQKTQLRYNACRAFHIHTIQSLGFTHNHQPTTSVLPPSYPLPHRLSHPAPLNAIKAIECFDGSFELDPDNKAVLFQLLESQLCCQTVAKEAGVSTPTTFTGLLFQPVPYSPGTKKGMPQEFEKYHDSSDYTVINVPPNYMFQAKIFKPARLCAIFKHASSS